MNTEATTVGKGLSQRTAITYVLRLSVDSYVLESSLRFNGVEFKLTECWLSDLPKRTTFEI